MPSHFIYPTSRTASFRCPPGDVTAVYINGQKIGFTEYKETVSKSTLVTTGDAAVLGDEVRIDYDPNVQDVRVFPGWQTAAGV